MQKHVRTRTSARQLPTAKPVQLSLPGIPEPRYPFINSLALWIRSNKAALSITAVILFLYLIGQGFVAGAIACGTGLFLINQAVDKTFGQYLDQRGNKHVR